MAARLGLLKMEKSKATRDRIPKSVCKAVNTFYTSNEGSCQAPGKREVKRVKVIDPESGRSQWQSHQVHYLHSSIKESYNSFTTLHPDMHIGRTAFWKMKPQWVKSSMCVPRNVCTCQIHQNFIHMLKAGHQALKQIPLYKVYKDSV